MSGIMPLDQLSPEKQAEIAYLVSLPTPPPKWLLLGRDHPGDRPLAAIPSRAYYEWHKARGRNIHRPGETAGRRGVPRALREEIICRDGLICRLCDQLVEAIKDIDIDHIIPVMHGGKTTPENLQVTHASCNRRKGARQWPERV